MFVTSRHDNGMSNVALYNNSKSTTKDGSGGLVSQVLRL